MAFATTSLQGRSDEQRFWDLQLATPVPPFCLTVSNGRRDPPNCFARDELSIGHEPQQRRGERALALIDHPKED